MNNIYEIGGVVSGDSFIGRKDLISKFKRDYLESRIRIGRSVVGLTRIGKTSFANAVFFDAPANILIINLDVKQSDSYYGFWKKICFKISKYLNKQCIEAGYLKQLLDEIKTSSDMQWVEFEENIVDIFEELDELNVRTIIVLDEFDHAEYLFEGKTHYFELLRTILADCKVSSMLLSRRQLHTIEKTTYQSSTFHGILEPIYLQGFDDSDMKEYFEVFEKSGIQLSKNQKDEIVYYAGRAPYLLSILGHYIVDSANSGEEDIDIRKIFLNKCKAINDYYRDCLKHLERDDDIRRIVPFVIGPNIGITKRDRDELSNLGYLLEDKGELIAISRYFTNFLSVNMLSVSIWDNIINLEKRIKSLIENESINIISQFSIYGENVNDIWKNILDRIVPGVSSKYAGYIDNNLRDFNQESTYIDALSLVDSLKIIKECWDSIFNKYFENDEYSEWENKFFKCGKARNPVAHGHEEYLSDLDRVEIDIYCKQIFDKLSKSGILISVPNESEMIEVALRYKSDCSIVYQVPIEELIGQTLEMTVLEYGKTGKSIHGIIKNKYKGIIPKTDVIKIGQEKWTELITSRGKVHVKVDEINGENYKVQLIKVIQ